VIDSSAGVADAAQLRLDYKDNIGLDNLMEESNWLQAPVLDGGRYYVVPDDITLEQDYDFWIYITTHGDPYGKEAIKSKYTLRVGCTPSITIADHVSFDKGPKTYYVASPIVDIYEFFEPIIDIRSTYCKMYSHDIVNIEINGTASATGISW
jgi:hypothetical protein